MIKSIGVSLIVSGLLVTVSLGLIGLGSPGIVVKLTLLFAIAFHYVFFRLVRIIFNKSQPIDIFEPLFLFPTIYTIYYGIGSLQLSETEKHIPVENYNYYLIGIVAFFAGGYVSFFLHRIFSRISLFSRITSYFLLRNFSLSRWKNHRARLVIILLLSISTFAYLVIVSKSGIPILHSNFASSRIDATSEAGGYIVYLFLLSRTVTALVIVTKIITGRFPLQPPIINWIIILFTLLMLATLGSRSKVLYSLLVPSIFYYYWNWKFYGQRVSLRRILLVVSATVMFVIAYGGYRYMTGTEANTSFFAAIGRTIFSELSLVSNTFDTILTMFPRKIEFLGYGTLITPFLTLLPGKQETIGSTLKDSFGLDYEGGGFTPTILGSFYILGGLKSMIIGMFFLGAVVILFYQWAIATKTPDIRKLVLYSYFILYLLNSIKGGITKSTVLPVYEMAVLWITTSFILGLLIVIPKNDNQNSLTKPT